MNGGAHYQRNPDGILEAQTIEGVQRDTTQGRKSEEPWKGRSFTNFGWGYFIPNMTHPENLGKVSLSLNEACPAQKRLVLIHEMNLRQAPANSCHLPILF